MADLPGSLVAPCIFLAKGLTRGPADKRTFFVRTSKLTSLPLAAWVCSRPSDFRHQSHRLNLTSLCRHPLRTRVRERAGMTDRYRSPLLSGRDHFPGGKLMRCSHLIPSCHCHADPRLFRSLSQSPYDCCEGVLISEQCFVVNKSIASTLPRNWWPSLPVPAFERSMLNGWRVATLLLLHHPAAPTDEDE